jgi:hypothetical protein
VDELLVVFVQNVASSTMLSSCSSLEKVAFLGRPGVTRLPIATSALAIGPRITLMVRMIGAENRMTACECALPTLRGLDPTSTNDTAVMISALASSAHHQSLKE